jgi:hypothetical protein
MPLQETMMPPQLLPVYPTMFAAEATVTRRAVANMVNCILEGLGWLFRGLKSTVKCEAADEKVDSKEEREAYIPFGHWSLAWFPWRLGIIFVVYSDTSGTVYTYTLLRE